MTPATVPDADLLAALFSDEPAPDVHAAVVVSHSGDECIGSKREFWNATWAGSTAFHRPR